MTFHLAIGNSDDRLTQKQWADFVRATDRVVRSYAENVDGAWHSAPDKPHQNACWAFTLFNDSEANRAGFRKRLSMLAVEFGQESIALNESETEFIPGITVEQQSA